MIEILLAQPKKKKRIGAGDSKMGMIFELDPSQTWEYRELKEEIIHARLGHAELFMHKEDFETKFEKIGKMRSIT